jgi:uncharacterized membrane protein
MNSTPLIANDAVLFGAVAAMLGLISYTSSKTTGPWVRFYKVCPPLLLCFFLPGLLNTFGLIDPAASRIYFVASQYLLPASLVLLTLSIDPGRLRSLGTRSIVMFLVSTASVVIGGPLAILLVSLFAPHWVGGAPPDEVWRGMAYVAGGWIGGSVNGLAMYETFGVSPKIFPAIAAADLLVAYLWIGVLLFFSGRAQSIDRFFRADATPVAVLQASIQGVQKENRRIPTVDDLMKLLAVAFGAVAVSHVLGDRIAAWITTLAPGMLMAGLGNSFLWVVFVATAIGIGLSCTRARELEHVGAPQIGMTFILTVCASIGLSLDLSSLWPNRHFVVVLAIWMSIHVVTLVLVARVLRSPTFFTAVASCANIGGPASAAMVASAFHPALMPVGVMLALLGYGIGTYMAYVCGQMMHAVAPVPPY